MEPYKVVLVPKPRGAWYDFSEDRIQPPLSRKWWWAFWHLAVWRALVWYPRALNLVIEGRWGWPWRRGLSWETRRFMLLRPFHAIPLVGTQALWWWRDIAAPHYVVWRS